MKVILSNKVYVNVPENLQEEVRREFTFTVPDPFNENKPNYVPRYVSQVMFLKNTACVSRGNLDKIVAILGEDEVNVIDKTISVPVNIPKPTFTPRDDQATIVDDFVDNDRRIALVNGKPGFGKTILALFLAYRLQEKTLVVCTTTNIRDQWIAEVKKWFGFTPGVIGGGKFSNPEAPIVIGNIQTVFKFKDKISKMFGMLIVDECHHCSASTFNDVIEHSHAKYRIGLSGTLKRKDGLHCLFPGLFSSKIYSPEESNTLPIKVVRLLTNITFPGNHMIPWAIRTNNLYNNPDYRELTRVLAQMSIDRGYKVLVTGDRVEYLKWLQESLENTRLFIGEAPYNTTETRTQYLQDIDNGTASGVVASTSIFSEGISANPLSMLIHTNSTNNASLIEQLGGRIRRMFPGKKLPIIIDIVLKGGTAENHSKEREAIYLELGWEVCTVNSFSGLQKQLT